MPITNIKQPEIIQISDDLRLRKYDGNHEFAFDWYQDEETVWLVDGVRRPYSQETLANMYGYLDKHGELYFIEVREGESFRPIGDVTFCQEDMPIVIGDSACRSKGIGRRVVAALIDRGRKLGYAELRVNEIYKYNTGSLKCFQSAGFEVCGETEKSYQLALKLKKNEVTL